MSTLQKNRLLSLRLQRKNYPAQEVERYLTYRGNKIDIDDSMYDEIISLIPQLWNTDKDKLIQFVWFSDGTFLCVRSKNVYNFSIKESEEKIYYFDAVTTEQLDNFIKLLVDYFNKVNLSKIENFYLEVYNSLSDVSYFKERILVMRNKALSETDYMFNSDYVFKNSEDEMSWKNYRQDWRDITEQQFWIDSNFIDIKLPVAPKPINTYSLVVESLQTSLGSVEITDNLIKELDIDYTGYADLVNRYGSVMIKLEVLKALNKLRIPLGLISSDIALESNRLEEIDQEFTRSSFNPVDIFTKYMAARDIEDEGSGLTMKSILDEQVKNCDLKLQLINEKLSEYNINISIGDIIEKYVEDMALKAKMIEKEKEALQLLTEIEIGES